MIKAAIIGLGWWGQTLARDLAASKVLQPIMGIDPLEDGRKAAAGLGLKTGSRFEEALAAPEIGAVLLCSPHKYHGEQIIAAAKAGKHVFCEKPLCTSATEAREAIEAVKNAGITLGIGHERRFEPAIIDLRARLARGELGTALSLEGNFSQDKFFALPPDNWRLSPVEAPVGPLSATGIHLVDLAIALLGEPDTVLARLASRGSPFANGDTLSILLTFKSGATALLSAILATPFMGRLALFGSKGWMEIRDRSHPEHSTGWDVTRALRGSTVTNEAYPPHPAVRDNLEAFARAALGGKPYPVSLDEMAANVRSFEAITRSATSGQIEII